MGISCMSSSYCSCGAPAYITPSLPNPDPKKFNIVKTHEAQGFASTFSVVAIKYEGCTNYEGLKILVFAYPLSYITSLKEIDPHFCDNGHTSPIARFEPTSKGWQHAVGFCDLLSTNA